MIFAIFSESGNFPSLMMLLLMACLTSSASLSFMHICLRSFDEIPSTPDAALFLAFVIARCNSLVVISGTLLLAFRVRRSFSSLRYRYRYTKEHGFLWIG